MAYIRHCSYCSFFHPVHTHKHTHTHSDSHTHTHIHKDTHKSNKWRRAQATKTATGSYTCLVIIYFRSGESFCDCVCNENVLQGTSLGFDKQHIFIRFHMSVKSTAVPGWTVMAAVAVVPQRGEKEGKCFYCVFFHASPPSHNVGRWPDAASTSIEFIVRNNIFSVTLNILAWVGASFWC